MKEALVLMAKAPKEGEVKTRLIGALSPAEATELYINFLSDTFALMESVWEQRETLSLVLCYTPAGEEEAFESVEREGSLMLAQRGRDLGERLSNCFEDLFGAGFDTIVAIGSDSPTLPVDYLIDAFNKLQDENDIIVGPSHDGGYYLIGMRALHKRIFDGIPWGQDGVLAATEKRAGEAGLRVLSLPVWYDVDTPEDLERLKDEISAGKGFAKFTRKFLKGLAGKKADS